MADALKVKKISAFTDNTAPADTDCFLTATGNVAKKTTVKEAKEALGIKELSTKLTNLVTTKSYNITVSGNNTAIVSNETNIAVEGYTPIAIAGFQTSTADRTLKCIISGNTLYTAVEKRNYSSGSWSSTLTIKITYIKNFS